MGLLGGEVVTMAVGVVALLMFQVIGGISASPPVSASLPPLAPAPSLHHLHHQPLHLHQGQHHNHQHFSLLTPNLGRPFSTVYRNPYDVTGSRELADALRTQDADQRDLGPYSSPLHGVLYGPRPPALPPLVTNIYHIYHLE